MSRPDWWLWLAAVSVGWTSLYAQVPPPEDEAAREDVSEAQESQEGKRRRPDSPYEAYDAGLFDEALQGFVDLQVERPEDPEVALNVGSTQYQMRNFPEADRTFSKAAMAQDPSVRGQALYNLGNSAYRQGRLQEAVELYKAALEIDPDDEDAKFNLEFVRDEIRRRHEEAQKRQQEQQDQQQQNESQDQSQESDQQEQGGQPEGEDEQQGDPEGQQPQRQHFKTATRIWHIDKITPRIERHLVKNLDILTTEPGGKLTNATRIRPGSRRKLGHSLSHGNAM